MASERAKQRAAELYMQLAVAGERGGNTLEEMIARELDRYACEAIVEASMRKAAEVEVPEELRGVAILLGVTSCASCPFCHQSIDDEPLCRCSTDDARHATAASVYEAYEAGARPADCPMPDGGVLVRPKP